ncbi:MAG: formyltransferase family protein [candidate division KSB1 bacterium]
MNIVLLCKRHNHRKVLEILSALRAQNLAVRGIVALAPRESWPSLTEVVQKIYHRRHTGSRKKNSDTADSRFALNGKAASLHSFNANGHAAKPAPSQSISGLYKTIEDYARAHNIPLVTVPDLNGAECVAALQKFQTDVLLLGGVPIIRAQVLQTPRVGTLNVHMAWLPGNRGMNVAEWSVYTNAPVAVTVHFVDVGVDTGAVLYREQIDIAECRTIAALREQLSFEQHHALARATRLLFDKQLQPEPQAREAGKQYYLMHERLKQIVERKMRRG